MGGLGHVSGNVILEAAAGESEPVGDRCSAEPVLSKAEVPKHDQGFSPAYLRHASEQFGQGQGETRK